MREWRGAAIIQMKPHSLACRSAPSVKVWFLWDQGLVLVLTHCAGIADSCSKPNSGTLCKTIHPATTQFLNKWMSLKLWEEQLFCLKGEQQSATYDYILSVNCEKTSAFWDQGNLRMDWIVNVHFIGKEKNIFLTSHYFTPNTHYVHFVNCSSRP